MLNRPNVFILLFFFLLGCGKSLPTLENIDLNAWQKDHNACEGYRTTVISSVQSQTDKLLALDEGQVVSLLGKPDRNELYKRNQKFFYYYLKPSPDCASAKLPTSRLTIRFNAMGLAKEVMVE